jgi:dTDP-glucose 4,6-dehydratase
MLMLNSAFARLDNQDWVRNITTGSYRNWVEKQYA